MDFLIHTILNDLTINYIRGNMGTIGGLLMSIDDMFKNEEKKITLNQSKVHNYVQLDD